MQRHNSILLVCLTLFNSHAFSAQTITLWTYYDYPPFIINSVKKAGLVYDLARFLSKQCNGEYLFVARYLPRKRLDQSLAQQQAGMVAFVSPLWFKGDYLWSRELLLGQNDVISLVGNSVAYQGPESLKGMHFAGLLGHKYPGIDKLVNKGSIKRSNVINVLTAVKTLLKGRTDVILLPRVAAIYQLRELKVSALVHYSKQPLYQFKRHLLYQPQLKPVFEKLKPILDSRYFHLEWLAILAAHNVQSLAISPRLSKSLIEK